MSDLPPRLPVAPPCTTLGDAEVVALAERLDGVLKRNAGRRAMQGQMRAASEQLEATPDARLPTSAELIGDMPTDRLTWAVLAGHAVTDPGAVADRWAEIRGEATAELACGGRLVRAVGDKTPLERARVLSMRDAFAQDLQPKGGVELALVEQAVMAYSGILEWQERLMRLTEETNQQEAMVALLKHAIEHEERWGTSKARRERADDLFRYESLRAREAEAARMVERYQRMFMRALRQFQEMRRLFASVHIHNRGQVNIADRQVNVSESA